MTTLYRHIPIQDASEGWNQSELDKVEAELGAKLPVDVVEFLKVAHVGNCHFVFDVGDETVSLGSIFRIGADEGGAYSYGTMLGELEELRRFFQLPLGVLPFAQGGGDVNVFLDLTATGRGRVVTYMPGLPEWTGHQQENAFVEVGPTFDAFLNSLRPDEEQ